VVPQPHPQRRPRGQRPPRALNAICLCTALYISFVFLYTIERPGLALDVEVILTPPCISFVILHTKHTGCCTNDVNARARAQAAPATTSPATPAPPAPPPPASPAATAAAATRWRAALPALRGKNRHIYHSTRLQSTTHHLKVIYSHYSEIIYCSNLLLLQ
jgi:hypothetical protein